MMYWAYGSNLNVRAMATRCPRAKKRGKMIVTDAALVFRGVADVVHRKGSQVQGGLWRITKECERALDAYEGARGENGFYVKRYFHMVINGVHEDVLFYQMNMRDEGMARGVMPPSEYYLDTIAQGYRDFGLELAELDEALHEAWGTKKVTPRLRERHRNRGLPKLARAAS